jgi:hypothetical protein
MDQPCPVGWRQQITNLDGNVGSSNLFQPACVSKEVSHRLAFYVLAH